MARTTPKTNWATTDIPKNTDINRIEGNTQQAFDELDDATTARATLQTNIDTINTNNPTSITSGTSLTITSKTETDLTYITPVSGSFTIEYSFINYQSSTNTIAVKINGSTVDTFTKTGTGTSSGSAVISGFSVGDTIFIDQNSPGAPVNSSTYTIKTGTVSPLAILFARTI